MTVAHVIFSFDTGGAETMLVDIVNCQSAVSNVILFIINDKVNAALLGNINKKVAIIQLGRREGSKNPLPLMRLNALLLRLKPQVIHLHNHNGINTLLKRLRKKAVLTLHDTGIVPKNLSKYKRLFAISEAVCADIHSRTGIEALVVRNGIDLQKVQARSEYDMDGSFRIIQVSRLQHEKKGQDIAIQALAILKDAGFRQIHLDLIGTGPSEKYLEELVEKAGLKGWVRFLGAKDRSYIYEHLKNYHLLIQPSIYEGFGLSVVEGLAAGLPVIASGLEGPKEILDTLKAGLMNKVGDAADLSEKILQVHQAYTSGDLANKRYVLSDTLRLKAFDIQQTATQYLDQYNLI